MPDRAQGRAVPALVKLELRWAEAPFRHGPEGLRPAGMLPEYTSRLTVFVKPGYSAGRIAIEIAFWAVPLTCSTNGAPDSWYFMVLRMPSQSVAPLKALGLRTWPS